MSSFQGRGRRGGVLALHVLLVDDMLDTDVVGDFILDNISSILTNLTLVSSTTVMFVFGRTSACTSQLCAIGVHILIGHLPHLAAGKVALAQGEEGLVALREGCGDRGRLCASSRAWRCPDRWAGCAELGIPGSRQ